MRVLALCAGVGGLELGLKLAVPTAQCVCYVEGEAYAAATLVARMQEGVLDEAPVWSNIRTFDPEPWRGKVDCVTGGFPCQPFSTVGRHRGEADPRHLWPDFVRILDRLHPSLCIFENVPPLLRMGFSKVEDDLSAMGYRVAAGLFSAEEVGASQARERLFIMAKSNDYRCRNSSGEVDKQGGQSSNVRKENVPERQEGGTNQSDTKLGTTSPALAFPPQPDDWESWRNVGPGLEPTVCRMANGMANRLDRTRAIGNGVVPLAAAHAFRTLWGALNV